MLISNLSTIAISTIVGIGILATQGIVNLALAEQFELIKEAELPRGFPNYTPVGQIPKHSSTAESPKIQPNQYSHNPWTKKQGAGQSLRGRL